MNFFHHILGAMEFKMHLQNFSEVSTRAGCGGTIYLGITRLALIKTYPAVIGASHKISETIPLLSPSIFYHHILPLSRLQKNYEIALQTSCHP